MGQDDETSASIWDNNIAQPYESDCRWFQEIDSVLCHKGILDIMHMKNIFIKLEMLLKLATHYLFYLKSFISVKKRDELHRLLRLFRFSGCGDIGKSFAPAR